jgi:ATP/maltotriose-dependent transcriptional regulator MalT
MGAMTSPSAAQAAFDSGAWLVARDAFNELAHATSDPAAFEGAAQAAWWLDDADTCLTAREQAFRRYREVGDDCGAARAATSLAYDCVLFGQGVAVGLGWLGMAEALLRPLPESIEKGWLAVRRAELDLSVRHDPPRALAAALEAEAIGRRLDCADLTTVGLALAGLALTQAGDVDAGMTRLDAAVATATTGGVTDVMWMGKVCCWLIVACRAAHDVTRAADWCRRVEAVCAERGLVPLFNVCRIQYASVQLSQGVWRDAEESLTHTLSRLSDSRRSSRLEAVVLLGELRRRQGRTQEADALFAQAEFDPAAIVGRARIRLSAGDATGAWVAISGLLRSIPGSSLLARAEILLPAIEVAAAVNEEEAARIAAAELRATANAVGTDALLAMSAVAEATLATSTARTDALRRAVRHFQDAGLRFDVAETRVQLAGALLADGDASGCQEQMDLALPAMEELGAASGIESIRRVAATMSARRDGPLTQRQTEVLVLVAQGRSNQEIAGILVVSEHTVHRHVSNILTKLDQSSRAGAVAHAMNAGLI